MYDNDVAMSIKRKSTMKAYVEAAIAEYEGKASSGSEAHAVDGSLTEDAIISADTRARMAASRARYSSFSESVTASLVTEALYDLTSKSLLKELQESAECKQILRQIISEYVISNGATELLSKMETASVIMSEMYGTINKHRKKILEGVDKDCSDTFVVTPEMKDEFFKQLNYNDSEAVEDAIRDRVMGATQDFITANTKDHEDINTALQAAQEKIATDPEDNELREACEMKSHRAVNEIRNRPKNVLHAMVASLSESVVKNSSTYNGYINENGSIKMEQIVSRAQTMYTFLEMLNTTSLDKVDACMLEGVIKGLRQ